MATPFYVAPEQLMQDRAEYARKGIARGRSLAAITYADGVLFVGENPSRLLYKTSEIYDRIAFAAVGKYNEFESLRVAGIRLADVKGYQYAREDVTAKSLATAYSQSLGAIFMGDSKPFEVEMLIAQVNGPATAVELFHILYDGSIVDESQVVAIGGDAEAMTQRLREHWEPDLPLGQALRLGHDALAAATDRSVGPADLEVSGLDRTRPRRTFFRLDQPAVAAHLVEGAGATEEAAIDPDAGAPNAADATPSAEQGPGADAPDPPPGDLAIDDPTGRSDGADGGGADPDPDPEN